VSCFANIQIMLLKSYLSCLEESVLFMCIYNGQFKMYGVLTLVSISKELQFLNVSSDYVNHMVASFKCLFAIQLFVSKGDDFNS